MKMMNRLIMTVAMAAVGMVSAVAEPLPSNPTVKVGDTAPDFSLKNEAGTEYSLSTQLEKSKVALLFYRSGNW